MLMRINISLVVIDELFISYSLLIVYTGLVCEKNAIAASSVINPTNASMMLAFQILSVVIIVLAAMVLTHGYIKRHPELLEEK